MHRDYIKEKKGNDVVWVIIDHLTKFVLFLPMKMIDSIDKLTWLYVNMVVRLHRVPVSIVLDQDPKFISCLWTSIRHARDN